MNCPRTECGALLDEEGVCNKCGSGSTLTDVPDYEAGRLFDEWWRSVPKETMLEYDEAGTIQLEFDKWRSGRAIKH